MIINLFYEYHYLGNKSLQSIECMRNTQKVSPFPTHSDCCRCSDRSQRTKERASIPMNTLWCRWVGCTYYSAGSDEMRSETPKYIARIVLNRHVTYVPHNCKKLPYTWASPTGGTTFCSLDPRPLNNINTGETEDTKDPGRWRAGDMLFLKQS